MSVEPYRAMDESATNAFDLALAEIGGTSITAFDRVSDCDAVREDDMNNGVWIASIRPRLERDNAHSPILESEIPTLDLPVPMVEPSTMTNVLSSSPT
jgi:hypothetical protein